MGTEQPRSLCWTDSLYITNQVWSQWRYDNDLNGDGIIFGFIDKEPKGVVVEFEHNATWRARYFVTLDHLKATWSRLDGTFYITEAKRLEVIERKEPYEDIGCVRDVCLVVRDRRRVPVWTQFR
jgi:hypothetical protein